MRNRLAIAVHSLSYSLSMAQDSPGDAPPPGENVGASFAVLAGELANDERFGTHEGEAHHSYRVAFLGPIIVDVPVTRVFSRQDAADADWSTLVVHAELVIRAFDVDACPCEAFCCEVDSVTLNGHSLGMPQGASGEWSPTRFELPPSSFQIDVVSTATFNGVGYSPQPGSKEVRIEVDSACGNSWAVPIDSVEPRIVAVRPALLLHGLDHDSSVWGPFTARYPGRLAAVDEPFVIDAA